MAKKKSEQIQLEIRHAIDDLVEDISEKMQEGIDRGREWTEIQPREFCRPSIRERIIFGKSLRTSYPDELKSSRDVLVRRKLRADSSIS